MYKYKVWRRDLTRAQLAQLLFLEGVNSYFDSDGIWVKTKEDERERVKRIFKECHVKFEEHIIP